MLLERLFNRKAFDKPLFLYVATSSIHGRGIFSLRPVKPGQIIEKAPVVLINETDSQLLKLSSLNDYYFLVKSSLTPVVIGLGFSSLYNHAAPSNAAYSIDIDKEQILIRAHRFIQAGEEITLNYNGKAEDRTPVLFTKCNV